MWAMPWTSENLVTVATMGFSLDYQIICRRPRSVRPVSEGSSRLTIPVLTLIKELQEGRTTAFVFVAMGIVSHGVHWIQYRLWLPETRRALQQCQPHRRHHASQMSCSKRSIFSRLKAPLVLLK